MNLELLGIGLILFGILLLLVALINATHRLTGEVAACRRHLSRMDLLV